MTPTTLRAVGEALYGSQWQAYLARDLGRSARTVNRWLTGKNAIPNSLAVRCVDLLRARRAVLAEIMEGL